MDLPTPPTYVETAQSLVESVSADPELWLEYLRRMDQYARERSEELAKYRI